MKYLFRSVLCRSVQVGLNVRHGYSHLGISGDEYENKNILKSITTLMTVFTVCEILCISECRMMATAQVFYSVIRYSSTACSP